MSEPSAAGASPSGAERLAQVVIGATALIFLALGAWLLVSPAGLAGVGLDVSTPVARTELRATYGGFELGTGLFLAWCCACRARLRIGLVATALIVGGFALGRLVGLALDRPDATAQYGLLALELTGVTLAVVATLWLQRRTGGADAALSQGLRPPA